MKIKVNGQVLEADIVEIEVDKDLSVHVGHEGIRFITPDTDDSIDYDLLLDI